MSSYPVFHAFHDRLTAGWTSTPLHFENENIDLPVDGNGAALPFVYVEIYGDTLAQETMGAPGANHWLEEGVAYVYVMTPSGTGSAAARQSADTLLALFREVPLPTTNGTVFMPELSVGAGEPGKDFPNYWALAVTIHWHVRSITGA
jgi:hypothetical protein